MDDEKQKLFIKVLKYRHFMEKCKEIQVELTITEVKL